GGFTPDERSQSKLLSLSVPNRLAEFPTRLQSASPFLLESSTHSSVCFWMIGDVEHLNQACPDSFFSNDRHRFNVRRLTSVHGFDNLLEFWNARKQMLQLGSHSLGLARSFNLDHACEDGSKGKPKTAAYRTLT